jgi:peptide-methionine (R)-S-oxide reductase
MNRHAFFIISLILIVFSGASYATEAIQDTPPETRPGQTGQPPPPPAATNLQGELLMNTPVKTYEKTDEAVSKLTDEQRFVTQHDGTEMPFNNKYWNNKEEGIYVDIVTGEPLFSSKDKYDSGTGWPSFTKPLDPDFVKEHSDYKLGVQRTEIRSKHGDSHLGHVFTDGPKDKGGMRYCMNSASLRFIPVAKLEEEGYGQYTELFK